MKYASITMGMLMYEDMKVSVLQLLSFGQERISRAVGDFSLLLHALRGKENLLSVEKSCVAAG